MHPSNGYAKGTPTYTRRRGIVWWYQDRKNSSLFTSIKLLYKLLVQVDSWFATNQDYVHAIFPGPMMRSGDCVPKHIDAEDASYQLGQFCRRAVGEALRQEHHIKPGHTSPKYEMKGNSRLRRKDAYLRRYCGVAPYTKSNLTPRTGWPSASTLDRAEM
jgi:hypothetical protein